MEHFNAFLGYLSKLFITLDGIGLAPIFIALTATATQKWKDLMVTKAVIVAFFVLLLFAYTGSIIFDLLDISLTALRIAGGLLLLLMAIDLVLGNPEQTMGCDPNASESERKDISVFPLAIPLLAGPATITMLTICMKSAENMPVHKLLIVLALAVSLFLCWLIMKFAGNIGRFLNKDCINIVNKIVGILLAAMSCELIMNSVIEIIKSAMGR